MQVKLKRQPTLALCACVATTTALGLAGSVATAQTAGGADATGRNAKGSVVLNDDAAGAIPGRYIVGLDGSPSRARSAQSAVRSDATALVGRYGGEVGDVYSAALRGFSVRMSETQAKRLAADPAVDFVQQSLWVRSTTLEGSAARNLRGDQPSPPSWGLDQVDGAIDDAYTYPNAGAGVTVYNTDTELNLDHQSFGNRAMSGYDFVDNDNDVNDCKGKFAIGHGTHTGGTSSGQAYGVAKNATIVGVKVLGCFGSAPDSVAIEGIDWVTQHAQRPAVANASWSSGGDGADPVGINQAIRNSIDSGVTWVVAAGNDNKDACGASPAQIPRAITVAATRADHSEASFSNHGSCVDIYAPGNNITSASNNENAGTKVMSGTSMAAPHVTGAAAIYLNAHPGASPDQVRDAIVNHARDGFVRNIGPGSPNKFLNVSGLG
jgi:subtilisin family serine protease